MKSNVNRSVAEQVAHLRLLALKPTQYGESKISPEIAALELSKTNPVRAAQLYFEKP